jgi:FlaA1/EpsC-like NDP-sugar epimerase
MRYLITGSGTLAKELVKQLGNQERIAIYSRSEYNQLEMKKDYPEEVNGLRYFIGDIRDEERLTMACKSIDIVIHTAALKQVDTCEYNPQECIKTNILGSLSVVNACNKAGVKKCLFISTDKAVSPTTIYGMSKACSERLFIDSNNLGNCRFSVVRYGNVRNSRGSVFEKWAY